MTQRPPRAARRGEPPRTSASQAGRTAPELATILLELLRVVKARRLCERGDPQLVAAFARAARAWRADLARNGPLAIELGSGGFREEGGPGTLSHPRLAELLRSLAERGIHHLRFEADLDEDAFAAFVELLAGDDGLRQHPGGFAGLLYARVPVGIRVNEVEGAPAPGAPAADGAQSREAAPAPTAPPAGASAPEVEDDGDPLAVEMRELLAELGGEPEAATYFDLLRRVSNAAERASEHGRSDLCDRAMRALADDAQEKREPRERDAARGFLAGLLQGARLERLLDRLAGDDDVDRIEAGQLVLALGEDAVAPLLEAARRARDATRRDRIQAVLVSMGDRALPDLLRSLDDDGIDAVRGAVRLLGETQHPAAVPRLADLLGHEDASLREEAARALVRVGGDEVMAVLARSLRSTMPGVPELAVQGLASTGSPRAVGPLSHALERAIEARDVARAKEVIRALGRLARPEVAAPLAGILQRRTRLTGRWLKDLKAAAATALGGVPGDEAVGALAQAAQSKDAALRRAAQTALDRRAQSLAREGGGGVR